MSVALLFWETRSKNLDQELRLGKLLVASVVGPEQLRVGLPQLSIGRDLSWRLGQVVGLRLEASLVGHVVHAVGVAVISDVLVVSPLLKSASLRLRSRLDATGLLHL